VVEVAGFDRIYRTMVKAQNIPGDDVNRPYNQAVEDADA
jgi:hypothetical protein